MAINLTLPAFGERNGVSAKDVIVSDESKKLFDRYFNKIGDLEEWFREFGLKPEPKIDAIVTITRNPQLAAFLNSQLQRVFEESGRQ